MTTLTNPEIAINTNTSPAFSPPDVSVIYILGGPGAGKGTQCATLVRDFGFHHLSAGDLLREEQDRAGSQYGDLIRSYIKEGQIVPMEVTVKLLENAMKRSLGTDKDAKKDGTKPEPSTASPKGRFLIDGFPRKMDQAICFEQTVCESLFTLFVDCPAPVLMQRLLERGKTSGRADDNEASIGKRFRTFGETSMPVVRMFEAEGRVVRIEGDASREEVGRQIREEMGRRGFDLGKRT